MMSKRDVSCILRLEKEKEPESWKSSHVGGSEGTCSEALASFDDKPAAKTLGMAGRQKSYETWKRGTPCNVSGKPKC